jgi:hypothetical protein
MNRNDPDRIGGWTGEDAAVSKRHDLAVGAGFLVGLLAIVVGLAMGCERRPGVRLAKVGATFSVVTPDGYDIYYTDWDYDIWECRLTPQTTLRVLALDERFRLVAVTYPEHAAENFVRCPKQMLLHRLRFNDLVEAQARHEKFQRRVEQLKREAEQHTPSDAEKPAPTTD